MPTSPAKTPRKKKKRETRETPKKRARVDTPPVEVVVSTHSDADKAKALVKFRALGTVRSACLAAGIGRATWYRWKTEDPAFAALVAEADEDVLDELEEEAHERAKESSDTLLIFLLKSKRRAIFGDKQTVTLVHPDVTQRLEHQARIIASRDTWSANELLDLLSAEVWK